MDAHIFRHISQIIATVLVGARIERIHEPLPGVTALSLYSGGAKQCLMLRRHRSTPFLFLTAKNPLPNPAFPPASVMRLRKYTEGRRLGECRTDWLGRRMLFSVPGPDGTTSGWLLLDLKHGPAFLTRAPEPFAESPLWPEPHDLARHDLESENDTSPDDAPWRRFQVLTPSLRRTLAMLDPLDRAALLVDLQQGDGDIFWYLDPQNTPRLVSAWPLPTEQRKVPDRASLTERCTPPDSTALPLLESLYLPQLLAEAKTVAAAPVVKQDRSAVKKRKRLLDKLDTEKKRLLAMLALKDDAHHLQAALWRYDPDFRTSSVTVTVPDEANPEAPPSERSIVLNPLMTVSENMQFMFKQATRAARGLTMLEKRVALMAEAPSVPSSAPNIRKNARDAKARKGKETTLPPGIQELTSSDGFTLWRGKNADGNRKLLRMARPFDLWFHVEDGPSTHLVLRREHANQSVPERTLEEAAILTGLKSWRRDDPKAPVMVALVKHVHPIKGAPAGTVHVQETWRNLMVSLDNNLEARLLTGNEP